MWCGITLFLVFFFVTFSLYTGCCIGICLNEANTICTCFGEAFTFWPKLWICKAVLHRNAWWQCHTDYASEEHDKCEFPWKGLTLESCWSFPIFLKTSSLAQLTSRDIYDQVRPWWFSSFVSSEGHHHTSIKSLLNMMNEKCSLSFLDEAALSERELWVIYNLCMCSSCKFFTFNGF